MARTPFRIRVWFDDGTDADYDVVAVNLSAYVGEELQISTENGLTVSAPDEAENKEDE